MLTWVHLCFTFSKLEGTTEGQPSGIFYFTHEKQINMLISRLGFNKDPQPPTHDNYDTMAKRKFRSSLLLPFTSNMMAVFYKWVLKAAKNIEQICFNNFLQKVKNIIQYILLNSYSIYLNNSVQKYMYIKTFLWYIYIHRSNYNQLFFIANTKS